MSSSSRHWSLTINNPTAADEALVKDAPNQYKWVKEIIGQKEVGENGTEHYQLYLRTDKVRFSQVKSVFTRAHIESGRNPAALKNYVQKDDTAVAGTRTAVRQAMPTDIYGYILQAYVHSPNYWQTVNYPKEFKTLEDVAYAHQCWIQYETSFDYFGDSFPMRLLKEASNAMVRDGWYVEHIASNPAFKIAFKEHLHSIMYRQNAQVFSPLPTLTQAEVLSSQDGTESSSPQDDRTNGDLLY